jgi:hypothetical protein
MDNFSLYKIQPEMPMRVRRLFFQGRAKCSRGRGPGKNILLAQKAPKKILFFLKKIKKHTILPGPEGARALSCPLLRTPMVSLLCNAVALQLFGVKPSALIQI